MSLKFTAFKDLISDSDHHQEVKHLLRQFSHFRFILLCFCCFWSKSWVLFCGIAYERPVRCWCVYGWMLSPWINLGLERGILARDGSLSLVRLNRGEKAQHSLQTALGCFFFLPVPSFLCYANRFFFFLKETKNFQEWEGLSGKNFTILFCFVFVFYRVKNIRR